MVPIISVIIPVYNGQIYLERTITAIQSQTFQDFEVIFVDDASTDSSLPILEQACVTDGRFSILRQNHSGAGVARNRGLSAAKGEYVLFSDCDDIYKPDFLEKMYHTASIHHADITACNFIGIQKNGKEIMQTGVSTQWLLNVEPVFHYKDCPSNILRIIGTNIWNKLYRKAFLLEHGLQFDELMTCNDLSFVAVSAATAEKIAYTIEHLLSYHFPRQSNKKNPNDVCFAIESTIHQISALPHAPELHDAISRFILETYISSLKRDVTNFSTTEAAYLYRSAHKCFNTDTFFTLTPERLGNGQLYREFCTIKKHDYETMVQLVQRRVIVSLTTYPRRIHAIPQVLKSLYAQTRKADEIVLWLATEQFPNNEQDLPDELLQYVSEKKLTIRWCDDLKSHKKYFYAFQEYPDDIVITVDDDLIYSKTTIDALYRSYLLYPNAVSTARGHLMLLSKETIFPYDMWIQETDYCIHKPSMQLFATGVAGILYPPHLFRQEFFNKDVIMSCCPLADDLWLKAMQTVSEVPIVIACQHEALQYIPDTQNEALCHINVRQKQNDIQLSHIIQWVEETFGKDIFIRNLTETNVGEKILGLEAVSLLIDGERKQLRKKVTALESELSETKRQFKLAEDGMLKMELLKQQTEEQLIQMKTQILQKNIAFEQMKRNYNCLEYNLNTTKQKLKLSEDCRPIRVQLKMLGTPLSQQRKSKYSFMQLTKLIVYYLAWIPEFLLEGMMYFLKNGAKQTLKQIYRKLFRRKK